MLWLWSRQPHLLPSLMGLIISRQLWKQLCKEDHLELFTINANLNVITSYLEDIHTYASLPLEISYTGILVCTCIKWNTCNHLKWPDDFICCPTASSICSQKQHFCKEANFAAGLFVDSRADVSLWGSFSEEMTEKCWESIWVNEKLQWKTKGKNLRQ